MPNNKYLSNGIGVVFEASIGVVNGFRQADRRKRETIR